MSIELTKKKTVKYPTKTTLNMAMTEKSKKKPLTLIIGIVIIAILAFAAAKFAAIDQLARLNKAESEYYELDSQNNMLKAELEHYNEVAREYRLYAADSASGEYGVNRQQVLELVESKMMSKGTVSSVIVDGNVLTVQMAGMTLQEISAMLDDIRTSEIVSDAELNTAASQKTGSTYSVFAVTINLKEAEK